jgi:cell division septation protein DedD
VQPALPQNAAFMVQIAAVSHVDDANVLMGALRKRGYMVVARREPADNLIHVQVGPFATRAEADAMGQRLLSDGYNAIVLP